MTLNGSLCAHHGLTIVPASEFLDGDATAVFRDPTQAILLHTHNLGKLRGALNPIFVSRYFGPKHCWPDGMLGNEEPPRRKTGDFLFWQEIADTGSQPMNP